MAKVAKKAKQKPKSLVGVKGKPRVKAKPVVKKTSQVSPTAIDQPVSKKTALPVAVETEKTDATSNDMVVCQAIGRRGEPVMLEKWRYDLLRQAILNVVPADDIGLMYKQLTPAVRANLAPVDRKRIGQLHHDTTLVKLDLEYQGELERIEGMRPQYLRRVSTARKASTVKKKRI